METRPPTRDENRPKGNSPLAQARGLAELAFGSFTRTSDFTRTRHLALMPPETLELNLADPAQRHFGDYELLERLGEGGMGVVYRALQLSLDREVAIKLLSAGPWASREFVARFEREAQNAARMQHPNIVTIYEVGSFEGLQFFSMRLVRGESLSARLRHGAKFTPRAAAALMRTIAEALDYAHSLGVLHLDLKPANVLLDEAGIPYVADFGLARRLENALAVENEEVSGTPAYMAPEQAEVRAHGLTAATDIWGLGAILYELLTGRPPFRADTARDTVSLVLQGQVRPPRRWQPLLPLDLQAIVLRCLKRDPAERYPTARALADDLSRFVEGRPVQARPLNAMQRVSRWARREPKLAATGLVAFAILLVGLIATTHQWQRAEASAGAARDNLWSTRAQTAQQALLDGDGFRGLRPLVANLVEMEAVGDPGRAAIERQRIGTILANAPQPVGFVRVPSGQAISSVAIAPDGRHFALATFDRQWGPQRFVWQYDMENLREDWSASTAHRTFLMAYGDAGVPHGGLHYSADGRFLLMSLIEQAVVPAPRYSDMIAIDARSGRLLEPKGLTEHRADIIYDDALKHALVRFRSDPSLRWPDAAQFYEVDGWKAVGPRHHVRTTLAADLWLPAPDGGAWLGTRDSTNLAFYDVPSLAPRWRLQLPQASLVRAWQFSHDGRWLALGSVDGAVRLIAVRDGAAVRLESGPAARVVRIEFSRDDRILAAIDENGQLWSWNVATRVARSAPLHFVRNDGAATIRFADDMLFGGGLSESGTSQVAYATLAPHAPFNNEAVPGAARLHGMTAFGLAFDVSTTARRLVTVAREDIAEIWRLPPSPLRWQKAAPLQPPVQTFDGDRLVATDGTTVRTIDVASGASLSPPLQHPEPVAFAELAPDGRSLVTIAGRTVRVIDARTWQLRGAPVVLPQAPERVALAQAAPVLVVTTNDYAGGERHETVHRIDLVHGARMGTPVQMDALQDFRIDPRGRHALVATWSRTRPTAFLWIALDDGRVLCAPKVSNVEDLVLAADGRSAWYGVDAADSRMALRHWDLEGCRELRVLEAANLRQMAVLMARGDGLVVHNGGNEALISIDADGRRTAAVGDAIVEPMHEFALSADGERAAIATRNAVHLLDARGGRRLSAPLTAPIAGDDAITGLVFSPDGTRLLARTINHRWLFWELPRATVDSAELARLARALDPDAPLTASDLDALHMRLGAAAVTPPRGSPVPEKPVEFAPAAGGGTDPRYVPLDLSRAINVPLVGMTWPEPFAGGDQPMLAPGIHRLLGVDYRIDGGVQLSGGGTAVALYPEHRSSAVVPVDGVDASRVHLLAFMHIPMGKDVPPRTFAHVVLIGADGRETRLDVRTVHDVVTHYRNPKAIPASARVALIGTDSSSIRGGGDPMRWQSITYAVTLDIPRAAGPIRGLRFDVADGPMEAPLFYAATLERAATGAPDVPKRR
jgi:hypothetical protein